MADIHCLFNHSFVMSITDTTYPTEWQIYIVCSTTVLSCQLLIPLIQLYGRYTMSVQPEFCYANNCTGTTYPVQWQICNVSTVRVLSCQLHVLLIQLNCIYTLSVQPVFCHVYYQFHFSSSVTDIHCQNNQGLVMSITNSTFPVQ